MLVPHTCPSCSHRLLRHVSYRGLYWRCGHCREEFTSTYLALGVTTQNKGLMDVSSLSSLVG